MGLSNHNVPIELRYKGKFDSIALFKYQIATIIRKFHCLEVSEDVKTTVSF